MDAGQVAVCQGCLSDHAARTGDEVDHPVRESGFLENLHQEIIRQQRSGGRFPYRRIPHECRSHIQIGSDGGKVKRSHCENKSFQRAVFHAIDDARLRMRLFFIDLCNEISIEIQEIDGFAGSVNLGLVSAFPLPQHGGGIYEGTVFL